MKTDMWAAGAALCNLILKRPPFRGTKEIGEEKLNQPRQQMEERLRKDTARHGEENPNEPAADMGLVDPCLRLMSLNPHDWYTASEALDHPRMLRYTLLGSSNFFKHGKHWTVLVSSCFYDSNQ